MPMVVDAGQMVVLYGFKSKKWPFSKSILTVLDNFADSNLLSVSAVNATIWPADPLQGWSKSLDVENYIQVTYFEDPAYLSSISLDYIYPAISKQKDSFEQCPLYASSLEEYLMWCSRCTSMFTKQSCSTNEFTLLKNISNAENAMIELEMKSVVI